MKRRETVTLSIIIIVLCLLITACSKPVIKADNQDLNEIEDTQSSTETVDNVDNNRLTQAGTFSDGLAWVELENTYGVKRIGCINNSGEVQFMKDELSGTNVSTLGSFSNGFSHIKIDNKDCIINNKGEITASSENGDFTTILCGSGGKFIVQKKTDDNHQVTTELLCIDGNGKIENTIDGIDIKDNSSIGVWSMGEGIFYIRHYSDRMIEPYLYNSNDHILSKVEIPDEWTKYPDNIVLSQNHQNESIVVSADQRIGLSYYLWYGVFGLDGKIQKQINAKNYKFSSDQDDQGLFIYDNCLLCYNKDESDHSVYLYHLDSENVTSLYECGDGKRASFYGYEDGSYLIDVSGGERQTFTLVDSSGKEKFESIEGSAIAISCDRIIARIRSLDSTGKTTIIRSIYDVKGNHIADIDPDFILNDDALFSDNLMPIMNDNEYNYIDIDGNLLFENGGLLNSSSNIYECKKQGWSIKLTDNWNKYGCIDESDFEKNGLVHFRYREVFERNDEFYRGRVFSIGRMAADEFEKWNVMDAPVPQKIKEKDGFVYYYTTPNALEIDYRDSDYERETKEYKFLSDDVDDIIKSFNFN